MTVSKNQPCVHVTFGPSAAGSLMLALKRMGRTDQVLCLDDDYSYGPLVPGDVQSRMQWALETLSSVPRSSL